MQIRPKVIKVPCGGWVAEREQERHIEGCEYCEAIQELKIAKVNNVFKAIIILMFSALAGWMGVLIFSDPWW